MQNTSSTVQAGNDATGCLSGWVEPTIANDKEMEFIWMGRDFLPWRWRWRCSRRNCPHTHTPNLCALAECQYAFKCVFSYTFLRLFIIGRERFPSTEYFPLKNFISWDGSKTWLDATKSYRAVRNKSATTSTLIQTPWWTNDCRALYRMFVSLDAIFAVPMTNDSIYRNTLSFIAVAR